MHKQPEITDKTRNIFIDVFCELYKQKPIEKITVQEITRLSGYNRSTFYQYFTDIYQLLQYIEDDVLSFIEKAPLSDVPANQLSDAAIHHVAHIFDEKSSYMGALLGDYSSVQFLDGIKDKLMSNFSKVTALPNDDELVRYVQEFCVSAVISTYRYWYRNSKNISFDNLVALIHTLITEGTFGQARKKGLATDKD